MTSNAKKFLRGDWEQLWLQAKRENKKEVEHTAAKRKNGPPPPQSIRARVSYAQYCARKGALSKANQELTSELTPNSDPANIHTLREKHPDPTHRDRDPTMVSSNLWPRPAENNEYWLSEDGQAYINKHFSMDKVQRYFRTRSPVGAADIDGWKARDLIAQ